MVFKLVMHRNTKKPLVGLITSLYAIDSHHENFIQEIKNICNHNVHVHIEFTFCNFVLTNSQEVNKKLYELVNWILMETHYNLKLFECFENIPLYETWNFLISNIECVYVSNINPDDKRPFNYLSTLLQELDSDDSLLVVFPVYKPYKTRNVNTSSTENNRTWFLNREHFYFDRKNNLKRISLGSVTKNNYISMKDFFYYKPCTNSHQFISQQKNFSKCFTPNCLVNSCPIWKKSLHDEVGYFSQEANIPSDYLLWLQIQKYSSGRMKQIITLSCDFYFDGISNLHLSHHFSDSHWSFLVDNYLLPSIT